MGTNYKAVMMKPGDKVATALEKMPVNSVVTVSCQDHVYTVELLEEIDFGHKFAVTSISQGSKIIKYGEVIGKAMEDIEPGSHVHVHNIEGIRGRGDRVAINT